MSEHSFDLIVIGSGPGGSAASVRAAELGFKTACVEKNETFGGTCLNVGCIPSKALLQSSWHFDFLKRHAKEHGIECDGMTLHFDQMMGRKRKIVGDLATGLDFLLKSKKVKTYRGNAEFLSAESLRVGENVLSAKTFLLATGSFSVELPFMKFDEKKVISSTGALNLCSVPKKMVVIGAGVIGVELASVYNRLGCEVVLVEMMDQICTGMDSDICQALLISLKKQGMTFYLGTKVLEADCSKEQVLLKVKTKDEELQISGDVVLVSVGRAPYTKELNLEVAGVGKSKQGYIVVDQNFCTSNPHIYAIGDLIEGPMLAHRASEEAVAAVEFLAGLKSDVCYAAIPGVIYTDPEAASVGYSEEDLNKAGIKYFKGLSAFKPNARARCLGEQEGFVKILIATNSRKILGVHMFGPNASELISECALVIKNQLTIEELADTSHPHPTLSETIKAAAFHALGKTAV